MADTRQHIKVHYRVDGATKVDEFEADGRTVIAMVGGSDASGQVADVQYERVYRVLRRPVKIAPGVSCDTP